MLVYHSMVNLTKVSLIQTMALFVLFLLFVFFLFSIFLFIFSKHFKVTFIQKCCNLARNKLGNKPHLMNNEYKNISLFVILHRYKGSALVSVKPYNAVCENFNTTHVQFCREPSFKSEFLAPITSILFNSP